MCRNLSASRRAHTAQTALLTLALVLRAVRYDGLMRMSTTPTLSWVAVGDSFTTGVGDASDGGGWVARTVRALNDAGPRVTLDNHAVSGAHIAAVLADQVPKLAGEATIVSAIAGANNVLQYVYRPVELAAQIRRLLRIAGEHGRIVFTATCPDFFAHRHGPSSKLTRRIAELNTSVLAIAASENVLVLDVHEVLQLAELWHPDGIHPNELGHRVLAGRALDLLTPQLSGMHPEAFESSLLA